MEWEYKNTIIKIEGDGKFRFNLRSRNYTFDTLQKAKSCIDELLKEYYTFTKKDYYELIDSVPNKKYEHFITAIIKELYHHQDSDYCDLDISGLDFDIEFKEILGY